MDFLVLFECERRSPPMASGGRCWPGTAPMVARCARSSSASTGARVMVDRLIEAAPGAWRDITKLIRKPTATGPAFVEPLEQ